MTAGAGFPHRAGLLAAAAGVLVDLAAGDPPDRWHPVAWFGSLMEIVERRAWADSRVAGACYSVVGVAIGAAAGVVLHTSADLVGCRPELATLVAAGVCVGGRGLDEAAERVARALDEGDVEEARRLLPWLVGRDPSDLDASEIARAAVESLAENTVDAVVAPVLWAAAGGAPGVLAYRAVNTLDAMVGHRSARYDRFGWSAARLDDLANWVPARVAAGLAACVRPARKAAIWRAVRTQAPRHPSPNGGVVEAAFAGALGCRLGGTNDYSGRIEHRPPLGEGPPPGAADIARARRLARHVDLALVVGLLACAVASRCASRQPGRR
ncbi:MAG: adenosylcobinamide-phosphate synthase CbiB [Acidimicrobiales bacterium]